MDNESRPMKRLSTEDEETASSLLDNAFETSHGRYTYAEVRAAMKGEPYPMSLTGNDAKLVIAAINQGIDAHLEACFCPSRGDVYEQEDRQICTALSCKVSSESLPVLLRRLAELSYKEPADEEAAERADAADSLANGILETLEILRD